MMAPKRNARTPLATGALLLVPLAALWIILSPMRRHGSDGERASALGGVGTAGGAGTGTVGGAGSLPGGVKPPGPGVSSVPPVSPPPRVAAGPPVQAEWTLLGVTLTPMNGIPTPPPPLAPPVGVLENPEVTRNPFLRSAPGATGLWIGVRDGVGIKTLTLAPDDHRHVYPLGRYSLVVIPTPGHPGGTTSEWAGPDGPMPLGPGMQPPYTLTYGFQPPKPGRPSAQTATLTPAPFSDQFRITAQPLSAEGRPTGSPIHLLCQPVTANALFVQIPTGYDAVTRQFQVSVARVDAEAKSGGAAWRIADIPPAVATGAGAPAPDARLGLFTLHADAVEAEDTSGSEDSTNLHSYWATRPYVFNEDGHLWTGAPTIRYLLTAHAASPPPPGQSWLLQVDRVTPQWALPPPPVQGASQTSNLIPLPPAYTRPDTHQWVIQDGQIGVAYPGQQQRVTITGTAIRSSVRTEMVTFHNAKVVWDAGFGGDRIVWQRPETETTPSGIAFSVLNGRFGKLDTTVPPSDSQFNPQFWWYDRGNAELLLAWHLPPGMVSGQTAPLNAPRVALLPSQFYSPQADVPLEAGKIVATWDNFRPEPYMGAAAPPGEKNARGLS